MSLFKNNNPEGGEVLPIDKVTRHFINRVYKKQIKNFNIAMKRYCEEHNLKNDFETFLYHEWNGFTSPAYNYLFILPVIYLVNSTAFMNYYYQLDKDFQDDLVTISEINALKKELKRNEEMVIYLRKIMGKDALL